MSDTQSEVDWAEKIGKPTLANLREMVAALKCDYCRLQDLRDEHTTLVEALADARILEEDDRKALSAYGTVAAEDEQEAAGLAKALEDDGLAVNAADNALDDWDEDNKEELAELEAAAMPCGNACSSTDDAEQMIHEDPLSVEVRSDWTTPGGEMTAGEFQILLSTGGPATRIMGELDDHGEPYRAWLEVQDWFKPWTEYHEADDREVCLAYARCFVFTS